MDEVEPSLGRNLCRLGQLSLHGGPPPSHNPPNIENVAAGAGFADTAQK
jgi:hypothetical protein